MTPVTVSTYYEEDHRRLDGLFKKFQSLKHLNFDEAKPYFKEFKLGLQRHILWEEEILFPVFEDKTGIRNSGPTAVMRMEHVEIGKALEAVHDKVRNRRTDSDRDEVRLVEILSAHNRKEETVLYPFMDTVATDKEKEEIFKKMETYQIDLTKCCGVR